MNKKNIDKLLKPSTVAIVGASENPGFGRDTTKNYLKFSNNLKNLYLINPKRDKVFGHKAYDSLLDVENDIDLVILCTPQKTIIPLLKEAAEKNCGGAVVFASGYSEVGEDGKTKQKELVQIADDLGIAIMGPNCAGFANYIKGIFAFAFLIEDRDRKGDIGFISQSGQIILGGLDKPNMGFSYCISSGNSCNVKVEDYIDFLVDDENTKVVAAYIEGVTKPAQLVETFRKAAKMKKPVIILKTGKSNKSQELAASHTGSLSGSDKVLRSMFKRYGVIEAEDIEELLGLANAFSWLDRLPTGSRTVFMNVSGGEAGVTADLAEKYGLEFAQYMPETKKYLESLLPEYGTVNNPFDMTAEIGYNTPVLCDAIKKISKDKNVDAIAMCYTITPEIWDETITHMVEAVKLAKEENINKPIFWMPFIEHTRHLESANILKENGVPLLSTGKYACSILKKIYDFISFEFIDIEAAIPEIKDNDTITLSEYESLSYLEDRGIHVPDMELALTSEGAIEKAESLTYPLSVKVNSRDILHKSDVGGVKLNIESEEELINAFDDIMHNCSKNRPEADIEGVLLKPMLDVEVEMIIGINNNKDFGPMIMIGMGGVFVELFKDVNLAPVPVNKKQAMSMIKELKAYPLLTGYRGNKICNIDELAELVVKISEIAAEEKNKIKELDLNPVFVTEEGVSIADGLLVVYDT